MKKILALSLVALSFSATAMAAAPLATNAVSTAGAKIYGGTTAAEAQNATNPLVRLSTGVSGVVNFTAVAASNTAASYAIHAKHVKGSKIFGTANDSTNVYWKASPAGIVTAAECGSGTADTDAEAFGTGWTAY